MITNNMMLYRKLYPCGFVQSLVADICKVARSISISSKHMYAVTMLSVILTILLEIYNPTPMFAGTVAICCNRQYSSPTVYLLLLCSLLSACGHVYPVGVAGRAVKYNHNKTNGSVPARSRSNPTLSPLCPAATGLDLLALAGNI